MSLLFDVIADLPAGIAVMPPVFIWDLGERPNSVSATGNVNINKGTSKIEGFASLRSA